MIFAVTDCHSFMQRRIIDSQRCTTTAYSYQLLTISFQRHRIIFPFIPTYDGVPCRLHVVSSQDVDPR